MKPERKALITHLSEELEERSIEALIVAKYDKPERLKILAERVTQHARLLTRLAEQEQAGIVTFPNKGELFLAVIPGGKIVGWVCKVCGKYTEGNQTPRACCNCQNKDFTSCWLVQSIEEKKESV